MLTRLLEGFLAGALGIAGRTLTQLTGFGLGFAVRTAEGRSPVPGNLGDYFWAGAYGTYFWVDPEEELYAVLMLQGPSDRLRYLYAMRQLVYGALT